MSKDLDKYFQKARESEPAYSKQDAEEILDTKVSGEGYSNNLYNKIKGSPMAILTSIGIVTTLATMLFFGNIDNKEQATAPIAENTNKKEMVEGEERQSNPVKSNDMDLAREEKSGDYSISNDKVVNDFDTHSQDFVLLERQKETLETRRDELVKRNNNINLETVDKNLQELDNIIEKWKQSIDKSDQAMNKALKKIDKTMKVLHRDLAVNDFKPDKLQPDSYNYEKERSKIKNVNAISIPASESEIFGLTKRGDTLIFTAQDVLDVVITKSDVQFIGPASVPLSEVFPVLITNKDGYRRYSYFNDNKKVTLKKLDFDFQQDKYDDYDITVQREIKKDAESLELLSDETNVDIHSEENIPFFSMDEEQKEQKLNEFNDIIKTLVTNSVDLDSTKKENIKQKFEKIDLANLISKELSKKLDKMNIENPSDLLDSANNGSVINLLDTLKNRNFYKNLPFFQDSINSDIVNIENGAKIELGSVVYKQMKDKSIYKEQEHDINKLIPISLSFDGEETDYILWYEPTEELINRLPEDIKQRINPELLAIAKEKGYCDNAPVDKEKAVMDVWSGCSGAVKNMKVYPNPASGLSNVEFELNKNRSATIGIYDLTGKLIKNIYNTQDYSKGEYNKALNLSNIEPGMYYVVIKTDKDEQALQRIIVEE